jgi:hypothetical protein
VIHTSPYGIMNIVSPPRRAFCSRPSQLSIGTSGPNRMDKVWIWKLKCGRTVQVKRQPVHLVPGGRGHAPEHELAHARGMLDGIRQRQR